MIIRSTMLGIVMVLALCLIPAALAQETAEVEIGDFYFQPESIEVAANTTVIWTNNGTVDHTVTSTSGLFDSGTLAPGQVYEETFTDTGTYGYFCTLHPEMRGEVIVGGDGNETAGPRVVVEDQEIVNGTVTVAEVESDGPGWIVIHADENGTYGEILGYSFVDDGVTTDVTVTIETANVTPTLYAMLHTDAGAAGEFEFPGPDVPVEVDGQIVAPAFSVTVPGTEAVTVALEPVASGLVAPVGLVAAPDASGRLFVTDQAGTVRIIAANGTLAPEPFLDLSGRMVDLETGYDERGLLGFAFHPDFAENGKVYVYYSAPLSESAPEEWDHTSRLSEFTVSGADNTTVMVDSERILLEVDQPQANHNGGRIVFGPDGYLYLALGDGGGANDVGTGHPAPGNGQNTTTLLGSILRIDMDGDEPYGIPAGNPFANGTLGLPEIYAYGFRNPTGMSFDADGSDQLITGDAGQNRWEEVDVVTPGGNYGWNLKEGTHCFDPGDPNGTPADCPANGSMGEPLIDPVIEYQNANVEGGIGRAVIGGSVYGGSEIPELAGSYVFGDWSGMGSEGVLFAATPSADVNATAWTVREIAVDGSPTGGIGAYLRGFGADADGELYILTSENAGPDGSTGAVFRLTAAAGGGNETPAVVPSVIVRDQPIGNGSVVVDEVVSDGPGWIAVHADENGTFGDVIGYSTVADGTNANVTVTIETANVTPTLYAMLHVDAGTVGVWEFPGADVPVEVDGEVVAPPFRVLEGEGAM